MNIKSYSRTRDASSTGTVPANPPAKLMARNVHARPKSPARPQDKKLPLYMRPKPLRSRDVPKTVRRPATKPATPPPHRAESAGGRQGSAAEERSMGMSPPPRSAGIGSASAREEEENEGRVTTFVLERRLSQLDKEREDALVKGKSKHTKLPRFLIQDNVNILAVQLTDVSRSIFKVIFNHMDKIYMAYLIYYALAAVMAIYVAIVGTVFSARCNVILILFMTLYGYLNAVATVLTCVLYRSYCELVIIINLVMGLVNHVFLFLGVLAKFNGPDLKDYPDEECHRVPLHSAEGLLGFLGIATVFFLLLMYGFFISIIYVAWKAKLKRGDLIEKRRNVLKGEITQVFV